MNNRALINNELQSIAPALLQVPITMPYTLPPDYFVELPQLLLANVSNTDDRFEELENISHRVPYTVPSGYFEQFATSVLEKLAQQKSDYLDEEMPKWLVNGSRQMPFVVPSGYFEGFADKMLQRVAEEPALTNVPSGYFESLPEAILAKVRKLEIEKELDDVAPILKSISKAPVQHVPEGYFEKLTTISPAVEESRTPVVPLKKKASWMRYAAAACVAGVLSIGSYFLFTQPSDIPSVANQPTINAINDQLASLDLNTIENYLQSSTSVLPATPSAPLSTDELNKLSNTDLDELLQDFTDQQLKKSIEESPELPSLSNQKKS